ncbi:MAG: lytic murein transglycosylase [Candidatus Paceibacterota bacterium]|nr:MAG: lytic murein transglycosylase [Candidatus Paceibacterota bacterium]
MVKSFYRLSIGVFVLLFSLCGGVFAIQSASAAVADEIAERTRQIEEIQRQINELQAQVDANRGKASTLQGEINRLNGQINQLNLEIRSLNLSIERTTIDIRGTSDNISEAETELQKHKGALGKYVQYAYELDKLSLTEVLLNNDTLSDFFSDLNNVQTTQDSLRSAIASIRELKTGLEEKKMSLEEKKEELERLKSIQEIEKRMIDTTKAQKDRVLRETKGQESKYQELVRQKKLDLERIRDQITYLQQNGVTAEDAVKFGQLAARRAGIRPAYLIAVLEVESGLGRNVGRCNRADDPASKKWEAIMHTRDHKPFLAVTAQLGLDPNNTPVSCPQIVNGRQLGWGGAMGPAQFIPSTWVAYAEEVARLVGRSPANPWNIEDAFMAAAVKLARGGATAQTRASEVAASKAYYSGNSKCSSSSCNSYANAIQKKAATIEENLGE